MPDPIFWISSYSSCGLRRDISELSKFDAVAIDVELWCAAAMMMTMVAVVSWPDVFVLMWTMCLKSFVQRDKYTQSHKRAHTLWLAHLLTWLCLCLNLIIDLCTIGDLLHTVFNRILYALLFYLLFDFVFLERFCWCCCCVFFFISRYSLLSSLLVLLSLSLRY